MKAKLNEELIENMVSVVRKGLPIKYACDKFGITWMSHSNYMNQGEKDFENDIESLHARYFYEIKKAQADYVENALDDIRSGRQGWQGQAWALERTRNDFMPKQSIETNTDDGKVTVVFGGKVKDIKKEN